MINVVIVAVQDMRASGLATAMHLLMLLLFTTVLQHEVLCDEVPPTCMCVKPADYEEKYNPCLSGECKTLMYYARENFTSDTVLKFLPGNHILSGVSLSVKCVANFTLTTSNMSEDKIHMPTVQCGGSGAGFLFEDVYNLEIIGLKFQSCGYPNYSEYSQALLIMYVTNMKISNVFIYNASGYGLYIHNLYGNSLIQNTVINGSHNATGCLGGNIKMIYRDTTTNDTYQLIITNSQISNGSITAPCDSEFYATGLDVLLATTNRINLTLTNVILTNNWGHKGGNMAITYVHLSEMTTWTSVITIDNCTLSWGSAIVGGGLYLSVVAKQNKSIGPHSVVDIIIITNTRFENNEAYIVGGGAYIVLYEDVELSTGARVLISNSTFLRNNITQAYSGHGGVGLNIFNFQVAGYISHQIPQYILSIFSCHFMDNSANTLSGDNTLGSAALYVENIAFTNLRDIEVVNNNCTGIVAIESGLVLEGTNTIFNNTGNNGGGLVLWEDSILYLNGTNAVLNISHNRAVSSGGGIYAQFSRTQDIPPCFFQFDDLGDKNVYLENNVANISGSALYGGSIEHCFFFGYDNPKNCTEVFLELFNVTKNGASYITSNPLQICFCSEDSHRNHYPNCSETVRHYNMYPGGVLTVALVPVGQMSGTVPGVVKATNVTSSSKTQSVDNASCTNLSYSLSSRAIQHSISTRNSVVNIHLTIQNSNTKDSQYYVTISVHLKKCPLGFQIKDPCTDDKCGCTCLEELRELDKVECHIKNTTISKVYGSQSWFGFITTNGTTQVVIAADCPFDYCNETVSHEINVTQPSTANDQCAFNRTGLLCGGCQHNLSHVFGSSMCSDCSNNSVVKVILLVVAFALAGLFLVLFVAVIDMTVAEGTLNAIIFYMNIVCVNRSTFIGYPQNAVMKLMKVFVMWTNLDLGIDVCFYDGMSAFAKVALQFVFPLYLWLIAAVIIILCRNSSFLSKLFGRNAIKVLATIILLSYAKFLRAAIDAIYDSTLTYSDRSGKHRHYSRVWGLDGNVPYWGTIHIILLVFAGIMIALTLPYTLALLFIQYLRKKSDMKSLCWVNKLKPFFDAYTGPYKDKYHFWTGFLLIVRITLFIGIATNNTKGSMLNITLTGATTSLLCLFIQPGIYYKKWPLNAIEAFTYINLIIYSIGTAYVISKGYDKTVPTILCVGSMFLLFCGVVVYHVLKKLSDTQRWRHMKVLLLDMRWPWMRRKPIRSLILPYIDPDGIGELSSSDDDEMDPILQNVPPVARYDEYREPLIETAEN